MKDDYRVIYSYTNYFEEIYFDVRVSIVYLNM